MYVTLHIKINLIDDIQAVFSDLLLMLEKTFSWEKCSSQNTIKLVIDYLHDIY